jgi:hypothetical protein
MMQVVIVFPNGEKSGVGICHLMLISFFLVAKLEFKMNFHRHQYTVSWFAMLAREKKSQCTRYII